MTGRHPWKTLLERLSPERREVIVAGAARVRTDIERRLKRSQVPARGEPEARAANVECDQLAAGLVRRGLATAPRVPLDVERLLEAKLPRLPDGVTASRLVAAERADDITFLDRSHREDGQ